jgi:hypothetical protein
MFFEPFRVESPMQFAFFEEQLFFICFRYFTEIDMGVCVHNCISFFRRSIMVELASPNRGNGSLVGAK